MAIDKDKANLLYGLKVSALLIGIMWSVKIVEVLLDLDFAYLGILPRHFSGLKGVLFTPFIHGDFKHLAGNSLPLLILSTILYSSYARVASKVLLMTWFIGGFWVWFASVDPVYHIGASGVVYGLAAFLLASGVFRRDRKAVAISLIVTMLYGGMIWGLLPIQEGVSWESHLFGAIAGVICALYFKNVDLPQPELLDDEEGLNRELHFFETVDEIERREVLGMPPAQEMKIRYIFKPRDPLASDQIEPE